MWGGRGFSEPGANLGALHFETELEWHYFQWVFFTEAVGWNSMFSAERRGSILEEALVILTVCTDCTKCRVKRLFCVILFCVQFRLILMLTRLLDLLGPRLSETKVKYQRN